MSIRKKEKQNPVTIRGGPKDKLKFSRKLGSVVSLGGGVERKRHLAVGKMGLLRTQRV